MEGHSRSGCLALPLLLFFPSPSLARCSFLARCSRSHAAILLILSSCAEWLLLLPATQAKPMEGRVTSIHANGLLPPNWQCDAGYEDAGSQLPGWMQHVQRAWRLQCCIKHCAPRVSQRLAALNTAHRAFHIG